MNSKLHHNIKQKNELQNLSYLLITGSFDSYTFNTGFDSKTPAPAAGGVPGGFHCIHNAGSVKRGCFHASFRRQSRSCRAGGGGYDIIINPDDPLNDLFIFISFLESFFADLLNIIIPE